MSSWSVTGRHPPLFAEARVSVTFPAALSAALGVYVVLREEAFPNVPVPDVVHVPLPVEEVPVRETTELFAQTVTSLPALTVGAGVNVTRMLSSSELQFPLLDVLRISITLPAAISEASGLYVALSVRLSGEKVPPPKVVQMPEPEVEVPFSETAGLFSQIETSAPALATGASEMVTVIASVAGLQLPLPVVLSVIVTVPAAVSAALGI